MEELFRFSIVRAPQSTDRLRVVPDARQSSLVPQLAALANAAERRGAARAFRGLIATIDQIPRGVQLREVMRRLATEQPRTPGDVATTISRGLDGMPLEEAIGLEALLLDLFISLYLAPPRPFSTEAAHVADIIEVAALLRLVSLMKLVAAGDPLAGDPDAVMSAPLQIPAAITGPEPKLHPVGTIDLLVVKQHLKEYAGAEVARVETVMRGEERVHTLRHTLSTERETTTETEQATETSEERETSEQTKLAQESSKSLSEELGVKAGIELGYGSAPSFFIRANAGLSYSRATEESSRYAQEVAKSVTTRAASKVSTATRTVERRRVVETFSDRARQGFANKSPEHTRGVYQFLEQVVICQVYNFGQRTIYDVTVPDPGAYLRQRALAQPVVANGVTAPPALTATGAFDGDYSKLLKPTDRLEDAAQWYHYGALAARYGVVGLAPPPGPLQVEKAIAQPLQPTDTRILQAESLEIPAGYRVQRIRALAMWNSTAPKADWTAVDLLVGDHQIPLAWGPGPDALPLGGPLTVNVPDGAPLMAPGPLALSLEGHPHGTSDITELAVNVVVEYVPTEKALEQWRHEVYDRIVARYQQLQREFEDARAAAAFTAARRSIGRTPLENRALERDELKKAVLALMFGRAFPGYPNDVAHPTGSADFHLPAPDPSALTFEHDMATIRFVEQAFEWEHMSFVLYPYFWTASPRWSEALDMAEDDAQLQAFLRAGAARVVLPVRPSFERDVEYFLTYEDPWAGGELPDASDPRYFDVADEQRARADAPGTETPVGEPWELRVATPAVWLRADDELPEWDQPDPAKWLWHPTNGLP